MSLILRSHNIMLLQINYLEYIIICICTYLRTELANLTFHLFVHSFKIMIYFEGRGEEDCQVHTVHTYYEDISNIPIIYYIF